MCFACSSSLLLNVTINFNNGGDKAKILWSTCLENKSAAYYLNHAYRDEKRKKAILVMLEGRG
jgi:hypothetical protein